MQIRTACRTSSIVYIKYMKHELPKHLLDLLVCPQTKAPLHYDREKQELISDSAKLAYPVKDGIPVMLVEEARKLD